MADINNNMHLKAVFNIKKAKNHLSIQKANIILYRQQVNNPLSADSLNLIGVWTTVRYEQTQTQHACL